MSEKKIILLTAGGTGGHFFPAVSLAEELCLNKNVEVHISTDNRCKKYLTNDIKIKSHIVDLYINLRGLFKKLKFPFIILNSLLKAFILILKLRPKLIIGFGGYPTFPVMFVGRLFFIPTIIYEQNSFFGKSNKFFAKNSKIIALAYKDTHNLPKEYLSKTLIVGDLVRSNIKTLEQKNFSDVNNTFNLLIIGGSQGAKIFSILVPEAIKILLTKYPDIRINVTQQVQKNDQNFVKKIYDDLKINNIISDFFYDIDSHYKNCHLLIARSGATTIAELSYIGLPAIFIPLPSAADDHQYYNAKALQDSGSSWLYRQNDITPEILANKLYDLITNPNIIKQASINILKRKTDGAKYLADTVLKIIS
jgi:UDP-N-acetylglucosamine--N-acetylmuramyl-(pentapeptide) pyrophosphoryl-undecaprenol N-acetylglucosamine transferase